MAVPFQSPFEGSHWEIRHTANTKMCTRRQLFCHSESANLRKDKHPLKKTNRQPRTHDQGASFKRPRRLASDEIPLLERKIEKSKQSIFKLKTHLEKGTCPKDLRYVAKANIFPDEEFKSDIRALRKEAEQKFIGALTRFHYRRVECNQDENQPFQDVFIFVL